MKTNALRILDSMKVEYSVMEYEADEDNLSADKVADSIGAEPDSVFKTLVAVGDKNGINVFVIPGSQELDLKKAALASNNKKIEMLKSKELLNVTGYIRGGCSPIGMKKHYPTYIDETAQLFDKIHVSAGKRGLQMHLNPLDLAKAAESIFADLI